jgi:hypothetical protein
VLAGLLFSALLTGGAEVPDPPPLEVQGFAGTPVQTASGPLAPGVRSERWWKRGEAGVTERIAEFRLERPVAPTAWFARWRAGHGCRATVTRGIAPIAGSSAPQLTFSGVCKGGDAYVIHLVQLPTAMVELHIDAPVLSAGPAQLEEAMRRLLARVSPFPAALPATRQHPHPSGLGH